jgi:hypothetical protein
VINHKPISYAITLIGLNRLQYLHKALLDISEGLPDEQTRIQINPGKWSIFDNIAHLQTNHQQFIIRIKQILEENTPSFNPYSSEAKPLFQNNCSISCREAIQA